MRILNRVYFCLTSVGTTYFIVRKKEKNSERIAFVKITNGGTNLHEIMNGVYFLLSFSLIFCISFTLIHHIYPLRALNIFFYLGLWSIIFDFYLYLFRFLDTVFKNKRLFLSNAYFRKEIVLRSLRE